MTEFGKMQELPFWKGKEFKEVTVEELEEISRSRAKTQEEKEERLSKVEEEKSQVFIPPSEVAASALETAKVIPVLELADRGIESLTRMDDREVVEQAGKTKYGEKFLSLFKGEDVLGSEEKNERSLMARLAVHTGDNAEQLLRIFRASGQYRGDKPNAYYEKMAKEEMRFVSGLRVKTAFPTFSADGKGRHVNAKA